MLFLKYTHTHTPEVYHQNKSQLIINSTSCLNFVKFIHLINKSFANDIEFRIKDTT